MPERRTARLPLLDNGAPEQLHWELIYLFRGIERQQIRITHARSRPDLAILRLPGWGHKFVYTASRQLWIGSYDRRGAWPEAWPLARKHISHPALLEHCTTRAGAVCAGYLVQVAGLVHVIGLSGHYLPERGTLWPVVTKLRRQLGVLAVETGPDSLLGRLFRRLGYYG